MNHGASEARDGDVRRNCEWHHRFVDNDLRNRDWFRSRIADVEFDHVLLEVVTLDVEAFDRRG
ncbi:MAG: hypothetical protein U0X92_17490 [Anaerolineales bacterium]